MKQLTILQAIQSKETFSPDVCNKENIGLEIQDFTEVNLFQENFADSLNYYLQVREKIRGPFAIHGAFIDLKPYSYDRLIQEASMFKYRMSLNMAVLLRADYLVFHSQINPFVQSSLLMDLDRKENKRVFHALMEEFSSFKGYLLLENVYEDDPRRLRDLVDAIDHPRVQVNLDLGHARLSKKFSLDQWFDILGDRIRYSHVHWNNGEIDQHMPPGPEERIEILSLFQRHGLNVPLSLEYFPRDILKEVALFQEAIDQGGLDYVL